MHCKLAISETLGILDRPHRNHGKSFHVESFHDYRHAMISFIAHFFLKILQRNSKRVSLGKLSIPGHTNLKWWHEFEETFDIYLHAKNQLYLSCFLWDNAKILQTYCFGYFGQDWLRTPKVILSTCRKLSCLAAGKKSVSSSMFL